MSSRSVLNFIWKYHRLIIVCKFTRKCCKTVTVTDSVLNCIQWIRILEVVFMNAKIHMVVMEVVSQHLDQYKNNGLISKLHEILSRQIWACCLVWFLINHGFILWLWNLFGIYYSSRGVALQNYMMFGCGWIAHLYFIS